MYVVIYHFQVKAGGEGEFRRSWRELTSLLREASPGYRARLHAGEHGVYVAYAQWPSRGAYETQPPLPSGVASLRSALLSHCEDVRSVQQMEVVEDFFA